MSGIEKGFAFESEKTIVSGSAFEFDLQFASDLSFVIDSAIESDSQRPSEFGMGWAFLFDFLK